MLEMRPTSNLWSLGSKWCNGIEVSLQDKRLYRALTLPNKLQVLLVSDTATEKAAAAMAIQVGHQSDPADIPGLAHFLEHMLFLGTEKYPDETSYKKFLSAHGGRSNAYTSAIDTNFYFDVGPAHLYGALDRFSQFFISPLFTPSAAEREMKAVDAENAKNYQNDARRLYQLSKSLANPLHPFHKFGTGNLHTLGHNPKVLGLDIRNELLAFYNRHYSANIMKLVVYGKEDLNTLEDWATSMFSPCRLLIMSGGTHPYDVEQQGRYICVVPVKDLRTLELAFPLPSLEDKYLAKPQRIVSHLLGHEGKGSLLAYLKACGYANSLSAGVTKEFHDWAQFTIKMTLTPEGVENHHAIIQACFQNLALVQNASSDELARHFSETQKLSILRFRFRNKERPIEYAPWLTSNMQSYPVEHVVSGLALLHEYNDAMVRQFLLNLQPHRVRVTVVSKHFQTTDVEPWLHAPYSDAPLSEDKLALYQQPISDAPFHLPDSNPFIPDNFDLLSSMPEIQIVRNDTSCRIWLRQGNPFDKPKTSFHVKWYTPAAYATPLDTVLTDLFVSCVKDVIAEDLYDADIAGVDISLSNSLSGLTLHVTGYSATLPLVVENVMAIITSPTRFQASLPRLLEKLVRGYANAKLDEPHQWASSVRQWILNQPKWTVLEKLAAAQDGPVITWEMLRDHAQALFRGAFMESLFYGNVDQAQSLSMMEMIEHAVGSTASGPHNVSPARIICLDGDYTFYERNQNPSNPNSAVQVIFQLGEDSIERRAMSALLAHMVKVPCFSQLRTQEQLGYIVFSGNHIAHGVVSFYITVQSNKHSPVYLQERVDAFCASFRQQWAALPPETFQKHKDAVVAQLLEAPKTYEEESSRLWNEIASEMYAFDRRSQVASIVQVLREEEVIDLFETAIVAPATRRRLSIQIFGPNSEMPAADAHTITDIASFKKHQGLFPARQKHSGHFYSAKL
ncbi:hypothetical protein AC1031_008300 [Aphanomyces cochlioides]|nr:hypothetical protein AC1031_008300 [Aphanomyces cochlioides]